MDYSNTTILHRRTQQRIGREKTLRLLYTLLTLISTRQDEQEHNLLSAAVAGEIIAGGRRAVYTPILYVPIEDDAQWRSAASYEHSEPENPQFVLLGVFKENVSLYDIWSSSSSTVSAYYYAGISSMRV